LQERKVQLVHKE
jgi:hypothetical protein